MSIHLQRWARLTQKPTQAELAIEPAIAALGLPYRFQYPFFDLGIFSDFAILPLKVIVEVDGPSHRRPGAAEKDAARDAKLAERGWRTVRVTNEQALQATPADVRDWLGLAADTPP